MDVRSTIINLSSDLKEVDLSLIEKDITSFDVIKTQRGPGTTLLSDPVILEELSQVCAVKSLIDPQWGLLAGRLAMENIKRIVPNTFGQSTEIMTPILDPSYANFVADHKKELDVMIIKERDLTFDLFAIATLKKSYLAHLKVGNTSKIMETPQYMYLRVATFLHYPDLDMINKVYTNLSLGNYSHATPTLFNAGMKTPQCCSCFLAVVEDDINSITKAWHDQAIISKNSGGYGAAYYKLRHSDIGQHGMSGGVVPWLKITNEIFKTVDQGGKRKGSCAPYLRDCHKDVFEFVELRDEGPEDKRAQDLFIALMISDLFMRRVEADEMWSLFCPNQAKGLFERWGSDFETAYKLAEDQKIYAKQIRARELWDAILRMQIKKGMPFLLYMDPCNGKSNQKNSGTIHSSNLCCEILEVTSDKEIASCTLASVALNRCVVMTSEGRKFDFEKLTALVKELVYNLDNVIDRNYYPEDIPEIKYSNLRHRPMGIGVQGLADAFLLLNLSWVIRGPGGKLIGNPDAIRLNKKIFETMYFAALQASNELAMLHGPYETYNESPMGQGKLQPDLWEDEEFEKLKSEPDIDEITLQIEKSKSRETRTQRWNDLRLSIKTYGVRHSLLIALMPTASSAHINGNSESFQPCDLISSRTVLSGQFMIVNKYLVADLKARRLWNTKTVKNIIKNRGSIQNLEAPSGIESIVEEMKLKYLTVFEIPQKILVDMAADRGRYICQTQSFNCFMEKPTRTKLNAFHFYSWKKGLKTGMYYLHSKAFTDPINMVLDKFVIPEKRKVCVDDETCLSCQS